MSNKSQRLKRAVAKLMEQNTKLANKVSNIKNEINSDENSKNITTQLEQVEKELRKSSSASSNYIASHSFDNSD